MADPFKETAIFYLCIYTPKPFNKVFVSFPYKYQ
jgi:hypothetical protein